MYGCGQVETSLIRELAPQLGIEPAITASALSEDTVELAAGNYCISIDHKTQITRPILSKLAQLGVRYLSTRSAGQNHIDIKFAKSIGITVGNVTYSPGSVADYTIMLILMTLRHAKPTMLRAHKHNFTLNAVPGKELRDVTVGVIGTGRIGTAVIDRLHGFGCRVIAYDHRSKTSAEYVSFDELLGRSDIVTLHTPLTTDTLHLLDQNRIAKMKHGAFVINTGRGALIDTAALVNALQSGRLGGAALDVIEGEEELFYANLQNRPIKNELLRSLQELQNVIITPHVAYYTEHALRDMIEHSIANCLKFEKENKND